MKKIDNKELDRIYKKIGFADNMVICGNCGKKGTIHKGKKYLELRHAFGGKRKSCYIGNEFKVDIVHVPIRRISKNLNNLQITKLNSLIHN